MAPKVENIIIYNFEDLVNLCKSKIDFIKSQTDCINLLLWKNTEYNMKYSNNQNKVNCNKKEVINGPEDKFDSNDSIYNIDKFDSNDSIYNIDKFDSNDSIYNIDKFDSNDSIYNMDVIIRKTIYQKNQFQIINIGQGTESDNKKSVEGPEIVDINKTNQCNLSGLEVKNEDFSEFVPDFKGPNSEIDDIFDIAQNLLKKGNKTLFNLSSIAGKTFLGILKH